MGVIAKCLTGILSCTYYPTSPDTVMVCPDTIVITRQTNWEDNRIVLKKNNKELVLYLGCPKNGT